MRRVAGYLAFLIGALAVAATFVPLLHTPVWWVRVADYPRLQLAIVLVVTTIGAALLLDRSRRPVQVLILASFVGIAFNVAKLFPFTKASGSGTAQVDTCAHGDELHVLSANVHVSNRRADKVLRLVADTKPDLVLLMETDEWWHRQLAPLRQQYPYVVEQVERGPYGMHLFSRYKLVDPQIKFFVAPDNPSIITGVQLPSGGEITFIGLHPRPPARDQSALFRDAELMHAAITAHGAANPVVLAGDLNSVPWERIIGRLCRVAAFLNPRSGRGLVNTYGAGDILLRWPLDYVLYQKEFGLQDFQRLRAIGSDHFPVGARLCYEPGIAAKNRPPDLRASDLDHARRAVQAGAALAHRLPRGH